MPSRAAVIAAGVIALLVAQIGGEFTQETCIFAIVMFLAAHVLSTIWDVREGRWEQVAAACALPIVFLVLSGFSSTPVTASFVGVCLLLTATLLIGQATVVRSRRSLMTALAIAGLTLVFAAVSAEADTTGAAMTLGLLIGWATIVLGAVVVNATADAVTPDARVVSSTKWSAESAVVYGAATVAATVLLAVAVVAVLPGPRSLLFSFSSGDWASQMSQIDPPPNFNPDLPDDLNVPPPQGDPNPGAEAIVPPETADSSGLGAGWIEAAALLLLASIVAFAVFRNPPHWIRKQPADSKTPARPDAASTMEPLGAFYRLERTLAGQGKPRHTSETPIELSLRLPGPPYNALVAVEQACYSRRELSESVRETAARELDQTSAQLANKGRDSVSRQPTSNKSALRPDGRDGNGST
ncbi:MAG TPA: DUF4129 domain-containing protein [Actinomycetes bacterium]|nr:DUF4129 domain-containing protein [Actinomycetes bacterium]